jgi:hypothetical protein
LTSSSERIATSIVKALGPCAQPDDRLG